MSGYLKKFDDAIAMSLSVKDKKSSTNTIKYGAKESSPLLSKKYLRTVIKS